MSPVPPRPGRGAVKARLAEILRVDHAGELVALSVHEIALRRTDPRAGEVVVHLPREHYLVTRL